MLTPNYLAAAPDALVQLYSSAELKILIDIARRVSQYDFFIPSAAWQVRKLQAMGLCYEEIMSILSQLTRRTRPEIERLVTEAGVEALRTDDAVYRRHGLNPPPAGASPELQRILHAGIKRTEGLFENLTRTTARTAAQQFERALDQAWLQTQSGAFSYTEAIRNAVRALAGQGIRSISYAGNGRIRTETLEVAVRRAVITGVNQTALELQMARADELGCDLVEVTAHEGARTGEGVANHAGWQGKVYSRSGMNPKYPHFATATGYGTGAGLGGWNCRHSAFAFFEGDPRTYTDERLRRMAEKTVTYNGEKLSIYEATQRQRYIERQVRRYKREFKAMEAAGQDPHEAAAKLRKWQSTEKDFAAQTGLKRQSERTAVHGFGRETAARVRTSVDKYSRIRYNKNGTIVVTDDWKNRAKPSIPKAFRPFAVLETKTEYRSGAAQIDRTIYDAAGRIATQIHSGPHSRPDKHPYGVHGEHAHTYIWGADGTLINREPRELNEQERIAHNDILGGAADERK